MFSTLCECNDILNNGTCQLAIVVALLWLIAILMAIRHFKKRKITKGEYQESIWQISKSPSFDEYTDLRRSSGTGRLPVSEERRKMMTPSMYPPIAPYDLIEDDLSDNVDDIVSNAVEVFTSYESQRTSLNDPLDKSSYVETNIETNYETDTSPSSDNTSYE